MPQLIIREIPDFLNDALAASAEAARRSKEKQALYLLETALRDQPAETGAQLLERIWSEPVPEINEGKLKNFLKNRGRRSNRSKK